jgi:integrase
MNRRTGLKSDARVFGYGSRSGYRRAWATICKKADLRLLTAHSGRHGFYTKLRVRQGVDPITAAKAGRWKNPSLPDLRYAHVEADEAEVWARFRTPPVQAETVTSINPRKIKG